MELIKGSVLTDPAILSRRECYGPTDLGSEGILSFFKWHECGRFCKPEWLKPVPMGDERKLVYRARKGTTMVLPTKKNRKPLSRLWE